MRPSRSDASIVVNPFMAKLSDIHQSVIAQNAMRKTDRMKSQCEIKQDGTPKMMTTIDICRFDKSA